MGFLAGLKKELRGVHPRNPDAWLINAWGGQQTATGIRVDEDVAMRFAAVFACVRILAETLASLSLDTFRRVSNGGKQLATDHPVFRLLHHKPNDEQTPFEYMEMMEGHAALWGDAYSAIDFNNAGEPARLIPLHPATTSAKRREDGKIFYEAHPGGKRVILPAERVIHLKWMSQDGISGISPISLFRETIGLGLAAEEFQSRFFLNDATPSGVLSHPGELKKEGMDNLRDSINKQSGGGLKNKHNFLILEENMQWTQVGIPAKDAELIATRKMAISDIARIYRMQLHKIGELDNATFSNIEEQNIEHVVDTIRPWAVRWEQAFSQKLIRDSERDQVFIRFNMDGLLRGNSGQRSEFYQKLWSMGVLSGNDIAAKENMNPFDGGDERFVPLNFIPLSMAGEIPGSNDRPPDDDRSLKLLPEWAKTASPPETRSIIIRQRLGKVHKRLFVNAAGRIVTREVNEMNRIIKRELLNRGVDGLTRSIDAFYEEFPVVARDIISPVVFAYGESIQATAAEEINVKADLSDPMRTFLTAYAANFGLRHSLSSKNQLKKIIRDSTAEELRQNLLERLQGWGETRAGKIAARESVQAGGAVARETYEENGRSSRWVTVGQNCPLCDQLNGKVVQGDQNFLNRGETVDPEDEKTTPLTVRRGIRHPQLHGGCDCMVSAA